MHSEAEQRAALECASAQLLGDVQTARAFEFGFYFSSSSVDMPLARPRSLCYSLRDHPAERLKALSAALLHSEQLCAFPDLRAAFWARVLSKTPYTESWRLESISWFWMTADARFPELTLVVPGESSKKRSRRRTSSFMSPDVDTVAHFFTASRETASNAEVKLGLEFSGRSTTLQLLQRIEAALDVVFATPRTARPFALASLALTYNSLTPAHLAITMSILRKIRDGTYTIEHVKLESFAECPTASRKAQLGKAREGRMGIIAAAVIRSLRPLESRSRLKSATLDINEHIIAALFSALRCGCAVDSVCLRVTLSGIRDFTAASRQEFWWWFAIGLFRSRPRRFKANRKQLCRVEFSYIGFDTEAVEVFADCLKNPARYLVFGNDAVGRYDADNDNGDDQETLFCKLPVGAQLYSKASGSNKVLQILERESELEVLARDHGRICVAVPGLGLAWADDEQILSTECEPLDESAVDRDIELSFIHFQAHPENLAPIASFFKLAGPSLSSLKLLWGITQARDSNTVISTVVHHCANLRYLDLSHNGLGNTAIDALTDALEGSSLRRTLLTLRLEHNYFQHAGSAALARYLSPDLSGTVPALRELRLVNIYADVGTFTAISELLSVNKTLQYIALNGPFRSGRGVSLEMEERQRLQEQFHGETLPTARCDSFPLAQKLAFLSVVHGSNALGSLDRFMSARIFQFAATRTLRRIVWI